MGMVNKFRNRMMMDKGRTKARYGRATGNRSVEVKGGWQRIVGATRQLGEQLKDSRRHTRTARK